MWAIVSRNCDRQVYNPNIFYSGEYGRNPAWCLRLQKFSDYTTVPDASGIRKALIGSSSDYASAGSSLIMQLTSLGLSEAVAQHPTVIDFNLKVRKNEGQDRAWLVNHEMSNAALFYVTP